MNQFISSKPGAGHHLMLTGMITEHVVRSLKNIPEQPLIVLDGDRSFHQLEYVFRDMVDYLPPDSPIEFDLAKRVTIIDLESLRSFPLQLNAYLEALKPVLTASNCVVLVCEGWEWPESFLNWVADAKAQNQIGILGVSSMSKTDLPKRLSSVVC